MREKVEAVLSKIGPGLGGTVVSLVDVKEGVVRVKVFVPSCGPGVSEEMALALLEEQLEEDAPEVKQVITV